MKLFYHGLLAAFLVFSISGCAAQKYSFVIDVPPKYSGERFYKSMEVYSFKSNRSNYGPHLSSLLKSSIAKEGYISVVESNAESSLSGALQIGNIDNNSRTEKYKCTVYRNNKQYEKTCYTHYYSKKVLIKADFSLTDNSEKRVVFGDNVSFDFDREWSSDDSRSAAKTKALSDDQIITNAINEITAKITQSVTPHKQKVERELQKGKDKSIALGITYLENGRIDQAISIWDQCIAQTTSGKDKAAAYYNIGVIKESQGLYRDAFELYGKANALIPAETLYIQAMTRVEGMKQQEGALRKWKN